jgi:hypothetical protein
MEKPNIRLGKLVIQRLNLTRQRPKLINTCPEILPREG